MLLSAKFNGWFCPTKSLIPITFSRHQGDHRFFPGWLQHWLIRNQIHRCLSARSTRFLFVLRGSTWDGWIIADDFTYLKPPRGRKKDLKFSQQKNIIVLTGTAHSSWFLFHQKYWISFCGCEMGHPDKRRWAFLLPNRLPLWIKARLIYLSCRYGFRHRGSIKDGGSAQQNRNSRSFTDESDTEEGKEQDCTRVSMSHSYGELAKEKTSGFGGRAGVAKSIFDM